MDITTLHMLNDKKPMNTTINMSSYLEKDLKCTRGSGH